MKTSKRIRLLRKKAGYQKASTFASALGVPQSTVSRWESGDSVPSLDKCRLIAQVLGLPLAAVFVQGDS